MSVLTTPIETDNQTTARRILQSIPRTKQALIGELNHSVSALWDSADPAGVLVEMGTNAAEALGLYQSFADLLRATFTAAGDTEGIAELDAIAARIPLLTTNQDGTITITPPEEEPGE